MKKWKCIKSYKKLIFIAFIIVMGLMNICYNSELSASTSYFENWEVLTTSTRELANGNFYVKDNVDIIGNDGESGIVIKGDVNLYIAKDKKLSVTGGRVSGKDKPSGAGIELSEGSSLHIFGKGSIRAVGSQGNTWKDIEQRNEEMISLNFGAGAGIGGRGGIIERAESDKAITTTILLAPQAMGTLYVNDSVTIIASAGQGEELYASTANIGKGGGNYDEKIARGTLYVAKSAHVSDSNKPSIQASHAAATWIDMDTINYDNQGGVGEATTYAIANTTLASLTDLPSKEGYSFLGYFSEVDGKGKQYIDALGNHTDTLWEPTMQTLYAAWSAKTYTLTLLQDGVDKITIDGQQANANGTYTLPYATSFTVHAVVTEGKQFVGWYGESEAYKSHSVTTTFEVPSHDFQLHAIATTEGIETIEIKESSASLRNARVDILVDVDGVPMDMGFVSLVSERGTTLLPTGNNGRYTYIRTLDFEKERYEIQINGKKSGKFVSFDKEGTCDVTIKFHQVNIHTTLNGKEMDVGEIEFINKNNQDDYFQASYSPALGYAQIYVMENDEVYHMKVADQWMREEVNLHHKQDLYLPLSQASINISLDGIQKNIGEVTLRDDMGEIRYTLDREEGIYRKIAFDTEEYYLYVNDVNTHRKMQFNSDVELQYYTITYHVTSPNTHGDVPQSQIVLQGSQLQLDNTELSRGKYTFLGWRNQRQLYEIGSVIEVYQPMQFYDTWQSIEDSEQNDHTFWVDQFGFATLDEAVLATQMSNSCAFGKTTIEYRSNMEDTTKEIYGTLPNGYVLIGNGEVLQVPKGKKLSLGDRQLFDDSIALVQNMNIIANEGIISIDGEHVRFKQSKFSLLPRNTIHLVSSLQADSELVLECLDEIGIPAIMGHSTKWKNDSLLISSDMSHKGNIGNVRIVNEGVSAVVAQSNMGTCEYHAYNSKDVSALRRYVLNEEEQYSVAYKQIQDAIDDDAVNTNEIYILQNSDENLVIHGKNPITFLSAKQETSTIDEKSAIVLDNASRTLSGEVQIKDNNDGSGTLFRFQQIMITKTIHIDENSKMEVMNEKQWLADEVMSIYTSPTKEKETRSLVRGPQGFESHFHLSNALLTQGYALYNDKQEVGMKYYGKGVEIKQDLDDITISEDEGFTLTFDVAYETGISDDINLSDAQYQNYAYRWQRKRPNQNWQDLDEASSRVVFQDGVAHMSYTNIAKMEERDFIYRCIVSNKVQQEKNSYISTREALVNIQEEPTSFVKIPKAIKMHQDRRQTKDQREIEELSTTNEITLMEFEEKNTNTKYQIYTKPTFSLTQKNNVQEYTIQVLNGEKEPLANDELLMQLQKGQKESGRFYLYGSSEESKMVGLYKGIMTFRIQRVQK